MPAGGALLSAGAGLLIGGGEAIYGASQKKKYQRQVDALSSSMPKYQINPEEYNIQNLAEARANQGMGAGAKQQLQNNTDRTLGTLSNAALMGGADANAISNLVDKTQNAYNQNAIYDDQARLANLNNLQSVWGRLSADKDKQWQINDYQPWKNKMTALSQQLTGANNMFNSGLGLAGSSLMSGIGKMGGGGTYPGGAQGYSGGGGSGVGSMGGSAEMAGGGYGGSATTAGEGMYAAPTFGGGALSSGEMAMIA